MDVYTFSDKPIENSDLYYGYSTTYAVMNGAFYKDTAPDNPQYINYGIKDDVISAIGEGGINITFTLSSDGETLTASSGGSSIKYIHYDKLPQTIYEIDPDPY